MKGSEFSRYRILEKIAEGGMGVVYRARDSRLERDVALKVIKPGVLADDAARRRFRREALALSQLNHPNIATLFDFDTHDGQDFLVMEHGAGETLDVRLTGGALPEPEVILIGRQIAAGLAAAHASGIIHCDIKPSNLFVTPQGHVKILDFGIARHSQVAPGLATRVTSADVAGTAGTLAYMAPELVAGQPADERSDLYAFGVVLYEMATGRLPFLGASAVALMYAVLNQSPAPPRSLVPTLSAEFEALLLRTLHRDRAARPGSVRELGAELERLGSGAPAAHAGTPGIRSLAVLPLDNLSGDATQEFFSDGMTEALIADLAKLKGLRVISRTSAMRYKRSAKPLPEIARELNVDAIVEGSVLRSGGRVRITAQLIQAATDTHLWAESYEREMSDVLSLQSEVARAIAREIQHALSPQAEASLQRATRVSPAAYDAYLKGRFHWNRRTEVALFRALDYFNQAIQQDPAWPQAHAGLADNFDVMGFYGFMEPREAFPRARAAAMKALELDETLGEAHIALAYVYHYHDWRWDESEREYARGVELNPGYAIGYLWHLNLLTCMGLFEEARAEGRRALELDPLSLIINVAQGWISFFGRDYERAVVEFGRGQELDPTFVQGRLWCGWALAELGRLEEAIREQQEAVRYSDRSPESLACLAYALARSGRAEDARALLAELEELSSRHHVSGYHTALVRIGLGETDAAFGDLKRATEQKSHWVTYLNVDPRLDGLRGDPRFEGLVRQVGLPE
ncbi:MAG: protein kinase [Candidatus Rokubacteria bacterium]|nr:protein kinase [Candidatus Rokubacteria bacterium]